MMTRFNPAMQAIRRLTAAVVVACLLGGCDPAPRGHPIMASAPQTRLMAVSAEGSSYVRILHVDGGSIVLMRSVFMPPGETVRAVTWSSDEREALITTSGEVLALDTRTWRLASLARLAAASQDDAAAAGHH